MQFTMKKSPVYPKHEANDYNGYEYSPHADFSLFLEEAKQNERIKTNFMISQSKPEEEEEEEEEEKNKKKKKKKKAWKAILLPWLKGEKKSDKPQVMLATRSKHTRRGLASGPVFSSSGNAAVGGARRPLSGPLMSSLFTPIKKAETEIPYVCLDHLGSPCPAKNYGPVYLVT